MTNTQQQAKAQQQAIDDRRSHRRAASSQATSTLRPAFRRKVCIIVNDDGNDDGLRQCGGQLDIYSVQGDRWSLGYGNDGWRRRGMGCVKAVVFMTLTRNPSSSFDVGPRLLSYITFATWSSLYSIPTHLQ